ncbi:guanitoxin biosynthesis heme-dependent pre-guanitoxin N-hydroxylase GntA [Flavobacterium algicola]|uniref:guanitoxin biosynthesis heme-dependent pre-guanitoxin N-hydroxylase GntA n=1 Tax=Flavobacterium algicola TaxID=556529 RepID=UPI001EFEC013|nr:guanitoxin biosynthesis heme-dependent pre-guanitoxin N-hydroxylase GntA [Flavobacterium algicola]MCG9791308.1 YqcI/YcgG family protein [Flavobacterium algicola]
MKTQISNAIENEYKNFIIEKQHPCVIANSVFKMEKYDLKVYDSILDENVITPILADVESYLKNYDFDSKMFESLIICFKNDNFKSELEFEKALWQFLQRLHDSDDTDWDNSVSSNPDDSKFSFSVKGKAFYMIGLHPESSRIARKAPYCTVVFNLHMQFEKLRAMGKFKSVRDRIRKRDEELQGDINPVLRDFGEHSETKQYSGRKVSDNWKCPFHHKHT